MPDVAVLQAVAGLGATGFLLISLWWFVEGRVRSGKLVDDERTRTEGERDGWRSIAETAMGKLGELIVSVDRLAGNVVTLLAEVRALRNEIRQLRDQLRERQ